MYLLFWSQCCNLTMAWWSRLEHGIVGGASWTDMVSISNDEVSIYFITLAFIPMSCKFKIRDQEAVNFVTFTINSGSNIVIP